MTITVDMLQIGAVFLDEDGYKTMVLGVNNQTGYILYKITNGSINDPKNIQRAKGLITHFITCRNKYKAIMLNPNILVKNKEDEEPTVELNSKYDRKIITKEGNTGTIDVYRVLDAFNVTNPILAHLAKKALCAGLRGHKSQLEDLKDIQTAINNAIIYEQQKLEVDKNA